LVLADRSVVERLVLVHKGAFGERLRSGVGAFVAEGGMKKSFPFQSVVNLLSSSTTELTFEDDDAHNSTHL
jgi:hypothetical protein